VPADEEEKEECTICNDKYYVKNVEDKNGLCMGSGEERKRRALWLCQHLTEEKNIRLLSI